MTQEHTPAKAPLRPLKTASEISDEQFEKLDRHFAQILEHLEEARRSNNKISVISTTGLSNIQANSTSSCLNRTAVMVAIGAGTKHPKFKHSHALVPFYVLAMPTAVVTA